MSANLGWLLRLARPEILRTLAAALLGTVAQLCAVALAGTAGWLIARAAEQPPVLALTVAVTAVRAFGIGRGVLRYAERLVGHDAAFRVMGRTRSTVYLSLVRAGPANSQGMRRGPLLTRLLDDVQAIQDFLVRSLLPGSVLLLCALTTAAGLAMLLPAAGVVLVAGVALAIVAAAWATVRVEGRAERRSAQAREELAAPTIELLHGITDLEAHRATDRWLERAAEADRRLTELNRRAAAGAGTADGAVLLASGLTVVVELLVGIAAVGADSIPASWLPIVVLAPIAVFEAVGWTPEVVRRFVAGTGAARRLRSLEELPASPIGAGVLAIPRTVPDLRVERVAVRWPSARTPTLVNISLTLPPGKRIGVVGGSGVGKTTLLTAMLGFLPTERGSICLDGVALPDLAEQALRHSVVSCGQEAQLFDNTIRNNLLLAKPDAVDEELFAVLVQVRLADWVATLPDGLDTMVGERGVRVSGGERQRLTLARALLANPAVLLLDEPTAYLDEPTAAELMRDLLVVTAGRSTVLVTHRLAGLSVVDEIVVLGPVDRPDGAAGRRPSTVVQRGTPTELMQTPGPYRSMWFRAASSASSLTGLTVGGSGRH